MQYPDSSHTQSCKSSEIDQLRHENQQLAEQVIRLSKLEFELNKSQAKLDGQVLLYRKLYEFGKHLHATFSQPDILQKTLHFVLYELNFQRCLILRQDATYVQAEFWDGYYEDNDIAALKNLQIELHHPILSALLSGIDHILYRADCPESQADLALHTLSQNLQLDEYIIFLLEQSADALRLIIVGNTAADAKYYARIEEGSDVMVNLANMTAQVTAALNQAYLYTQVHNRAEALHETLEELKKAQLQLIQSEKMSSLGQLVAGVAHEINNPVNFISGNLQHADHYTQEVLSLLDLYQQYYPDPVPEIVERTEEIDLDFLVIDLQKLLASMTVGTERIQEIVASLRTFSRMDEAEVKAVDIHAGIDSTLMILQNRTKAAANRPEIHIIKEYGQLPLVECYAGQLNQVFMNLLSNAIDALEDVMPLNRTPHRFTKSTPAEPTIRIQTALEANGMVTICIVDNGPGIPESIQPRLFDPFFTTKPIGKGTGMGLSISYQIITERHLGSLTCQSQLNKGTEFIIQIPKSPRLLGF